MANLTLRQTEQWSYGWGNVEILAFSNRFSFELLRLRLFCKNEKHLLANEEEKWKFTEWNSVGMRSGWDLKGFVGKSCWLNNCFAWVIINSRMSEALAIVFETDAFDCSFGYKRLQPIQIPKLPAVILFSDEYSQTRLRKPTK